MSESRVSVAVSSELGLGSGGGRENSLEVLRRLAVGDSLFMDIICHDYKTKHAERWTFAPKFKMTAGALGS